MARSTTRSNQRPDTLMQDRSPPVRRNHLQRTAGPYIRFKLRRTQCEQMSSGLPLKADIAQCTWHVSKVPLSDSGAPTLKMWCQQMTRSFECDAHVTRHRKIERL